MTSSNIKTHFQNFLSGATDVFENRHPTMCADITAAQRELVLWIHHFRQTSSTNTAIELLDGAFSSLVEAAALLCLGMGRSAIVSMRTQIDLLLGYTYFSDHPREWKRLADRDDGFMLRSSLEKYHSEMFFDFKKRLNIIDQASGSSLKEVYRILSAHVHSQSSYTVPKILTPTDLISTDAFLLSVVDMQKSVSENLANYLTALYAESWPDIPKESVTRVKNLLNIQQKTVVFESL